MPEVLLRLGNSCNFSSAHDQLAKDETRPPARVFALPGVWCSAFVCVGLHGVGAFRSLEFSGHEGLPFWLKGKRDSFL